NSIAIAYNISKLARSTFEIKLLLFFSSRRRHTISKRDWSSDVCSSDLLDLLGRLAQKSHNLLGNCLDIHAVSLPFMLFVREIFQIGRASCRERVWLSLVDFTCIIIKTINIR